MTCDRSIKSAPSAPQPWINTTAISGVSPSSGWRVNVDRPAKVWRIMVAMGSPFDNQMSVRLGLYYGVPKKLHQKNLHLNLDG